MRLVCLSLLLAAHVGLAVGERVKTRAAEARAGPSEAPPRFGEPVKLGGARLTSSGSLLEVLGETRPGWPGGGHRRLLPIPDDPDPGRGGGSAAVIADHAAAVVSSDSEAEYDEEEEAAHSGGVIPPASGPQVEEAAQNGGVIPPASGPQVEALPRKAVSTSGAGSSPQSHRDDGNSGDGSSEGDSLASDSGSPERAAPLPPNGPPPAKGSPPHGPPPAKGVPPPAKGGAPPRPPPGKKGPPPPGGGKKGAAKAVQQFVGFSVIVEHFQLSTGWGQNALKTKIAALFEQHSKGSQDEKEQAVDSAWAALAELAGKYRDKMDSQKEDVLKAVLGELDAVEVPDEVDKRRLAFLSAIMQRGLVELKPEGINEKLEVNMAQVKANRKLNIKSLMKFKPEETVVAFDFDLTLKAPTKVNGKRGSKFFGLRGGERLGLRKEIEGLIESGAEAIVVTAKAPKTNDADAWQPIVEEAKHLGLYGVMGKGFGHDLPEGVPHVQSETGKYKWEDLWSMKFLVPGRKHDGLSDLNFQAGRGVLIAGYNKGPAVEHYIYMHQKRDKIKQIIFVDDAVANVFNLATYFKQLNNDRYFKLASEAGTVKRPWRSALQQVDSLWWSVKGLKLDTDTGETANYLVKAQQASADNSYQPTPEYANMRYRVRHSNLMDPCPEGHSSDSSGMMCFEEE